MVGDSTNDKLRLLSAFEDDEDDSADEDEVYNGLSKLTMARTSENIDDKRATSQLKERAYSDDPQLNLAGDSLAQDGGHGQKDSAEEYDKYKKREHNNCYRLMLLMFNFILNGISFGLFIYSRDFFMETFKIEETMCNNMILIELFATLVGVFVANLLSIKLDRFHFLFFCSVLSSMGLLGIVQSRHLTYAIVSIGLFGLSMGFSTAIAIKWCLRFNGTTNNHKHSQNLQTNLLQVLSLIGLIIFFTVFSSSINGSRFEALNATRSDSSLGQIQLITTTEKVHLKKPSISDGSFLEQDHVTKPTFVTNGTLTSRHKRQMLLTTAQPALQTTTQASLETMTSNNLTTTEKIHMKKPETADGSFLEQSHITKPSVKADTTRSPEMTYSNEYVRNSAQLRECLAKLQRTCHLSLENCRVELQPGQNQTGESTPATCEYAYNPLEASALSPQDKDCADLMTAQSNHSQSADDCFSSARANLDQLLELDKKQAYKCFLINSKRQCDATASCKYATDFSDVSTQINQEVTGCFEIEWKRIRDFTSTAMTPTNTTTTTTSKTTTTGTTTFTTTTGTTTTSETTTTRTPTIVNLTTLNADNQGYIAYANYIFKLSNETQKIYLILAMAYIGLTVLHCVYFFRLIKDMLFSLWLTIRYLACCLFKSKDNQSAKYENSRNPLRSLQVPLAKNSKSELSLNVVTCQEVISSVGFWLILVMFFLYGGLLLNFLLFLKLYLTSKLGKAKHNHISLIYNMFLVSFMIGRICIILINSFCKRRRKVPSKTTNSKCTRFWIQTLQLSATTSFLTIISTIQLFSYKNNHILDISKINNNLTSDSSDSLQSTTIIYGIIFPGLLSTLFPQLFCLFDIFVLEQHKLQHSNNAVVINSYISLYVWQIGSLGAILVTLLNNYATFNIFKSAKVFAYSNCIQAVLLLVVLVLFVFVLNRRVSQKRRFITFNQIGYNELKDSKRTNEMDLENEEIELMVKPKLSQVMAR